MGKLLSGQQLFISKDIALQRLQKDLAQAKDSMPLTLLDPCLQTITSGGQFYEFRDFGISYYNTVTIWKLGEKLDDYNWLFSGMSETFAKSQLPTQIEYTMVYEQHVFSTLKEFQAIHYYKIYIPTSLRLMSAAMFPPPPHWVSLTTANPNFHISGDVYNWAGAYPDLGAFAVEVQVNIVPPHICHFRLHHEHPPFTDFVFSYFEDIPPGSFHCVKDIDGVCHTLYKSPNVTLF